MMRSNWGPASEKELFVLWREDHYSALRLKHAVGGIVAGEGSRSGKSEDEDGDSSAEGRLAVKATSLIRSHVIPFC